MPVFAATGSVIAANVVAWAAAALLFAMWFRAAVCVRGNSFLVLTALTAIAMLPVYHRFVDAVLLILPLCWAFRARGNDLKTLRWSTGVLAGVFVLPGSALMIVLAGRNLAPAVLTHSWMWQALLVSHQAWAVAALAIALVTGLVIESRRHLSRTLPFLPSKPESRAHFAG